MSRRGDAAYRLAACGLRSQPRKTLQYALSRCLWLLASPYAEETLAGCRSQQSAAVGRAHRKCWSQSKIARLQRKHATMGGRWPKLPHGRYFRLGMGAGSSFVTVAIAAAMTSLASRLRRCMAESCSSRRMARIAEIARYGGQTHVSTHKLRLGLTSMYEEIDEAYRIFENRLEGVIKVAIVGR